MNMHSVHASIKEALSQTGLGQFRTSVNLVVIDPFSKLSEFRIDIQVRRDNGGDGIGLSYLRVRDCILNKLRIHFENEGLSKTTGYLPYNEKDSTLLTGKVDYAWRRMDGPKLTWKAVQRQILYGKVPNRDSCRLELDLRRRSNDRLALVSGSHLTDQDPSRRQDPRLIPWDLVPYDWGYSPVTRSVSND